MTYDASNRKQIRELEKSSKRDEDERILYLRASLDTRPGRAWFYQFLTDCHLFSDPFTGDALHEAFLKGERNIGLRVFADITLHCPDQYVHMIKEANVRLASISAATERSGSQDSGRDAEGSADSYSDTELYGPAE